MPTVNQINVMDQRTGSGCHESCGYHAFKNVMLSSLFQQGDLSERQFQTLLNSSQLFETIFKEAKEIIQDQGVDLDLTLPHLVILLAKAKKGDFDFTEQGLSLATMQKLDLSKITAVNFVSYPGAAEPGLFGEENDLSTAATIATLARTQGATKQAFAVGINNKHWVTALAKKDASGEYSWDFMDSWGNQKTYQSSISTKLEALLKKNASQLQEYLLEAYTNANNLLNRKYNYFFDQSTGLPTPDVLIDATLDGTKILDVKQFFIEDLPTKELYASYIENRFAFMEKVDWLNSDNPQIRVHVKQLYSLTNFMVQNMEPTDVLKEKLGPINKRLKAAMVKPVVDSTTHAEATVESTTPSAVDEKLQKQQQAALLAVQHGEPKPTEGFYARMVNAIHALWEGIKNIALSVGRVIGLVY